MVNPFYNSQQRRLRAVWRILIQGFFYFALMLFLQTLAGSLLGINAASAGVNLSDSSALQAYIVNSPLLLPLSALASLLAAWLSFLAAGRWLDHRRLPAFGFHFTRAWWRDFGFGLLLGAVLMGLIFSIELAAGWVTITQTLFSNRTDQPFWIGLLGYAALFLSVGVYEEMVSRGYHLRNMAEGLQGRFFSPRMALLAAYLLSSMLFGSLHMTNPNATITSTIFLMAAGLFLGLGYVLTGELAIPIGLHITWNFFQGCVFGFPVSGTEVSATFIAIQQSGPELVTGGAFGPESGLIGLAAIALGSALIVLWVRRMHGKARPQENLAVYDPTTCGLLDPGLEQNSK